MKDQYVGDINDYLKYSFLRALAGVTSFGCLGMVWMLTPSDGRNDGRRLSYLHQPMRFRRLDPLVFDLLSDIVSRNVRTVCAVEEAGFLGSAKFVSEIIPDDAAGRQLYFRQARCAVRGCGLVFFDPDNGLGVASVRKGGRNSSKYLYWDEIADTFGRGHSVIVYQHFPRRPRAPFLQQLSDRLRAETSCETVLAMTTAHVAFVLAVQEEHEVVLRNHVVWFSAHAAPFATAVFLSKDDPESKEVRPNQPRFA
jgi:hypothetical protein